MTKQVLSVGQCNFDNRNIQTIIQTQFDAQLQHADSAMEAIQMARQSPWDLILINRVFDADGGSGLELIQALKSDPGTQSQPVMLVSNFEDAQRKAIETGALAGFGKANLDTLATVAELRKVLG